MAPREIWEARIKAVTEGGMEAVVDAVVERWFTPTFAQSEVAEIERMRDMILSTTRPAMPAAAPPSATWTCAISSADRGCRRWW